MDTIRVRSGAGAGGAADVARRLAASRRMSAAAAAAATPSPLSQFESKQLQGFGSVFSLCDSGVPSSWLRLERKDKVMMEKYNFDVDWSLKLDIPDEYQLYHEIEKCKAESNLQYSPARSFCNVNDSARSGWTVALDMRTVPDCEVVQRMSELKGSQKKIDTMKTDDLAALCETPEWQSGAYRVRLHVKLKLRAGGSNSSMAVATTRDMSHFADRWSMVVTAPPVAASSDPALYTAGSVEMPAADVELLSSMVSMCAAEETVEFSQQLGGRPYVLLHNNPAQFAKGVADGGVVLQKCGGFSESNGGASARMESQLLLSADSALLLTSKFEREDAKRRKTYNPITLHVKLRENPAGDYYSEKPTAEQEKLDRTAANVFSVYAASLRTFVAQASALFEESGDSKNAEQRRDKFAKMEARAQKPAGLDKMVRKFMLVDPANIAAGEGSEADGEELAKLSPSMRGLAESLPAFDGDSDIQHANVVPRFKDGGVECVIDVEFDTKVYAYHADSGVFEPIDPYAEHPTSVKLLACAATYRLRHKVDLNGSRGQLIDAFGKLKADVIVYDAAGCGFGGGGGGGGGGGFFGGGGGGAVAPTDFQF